MTAKEVKAIVGDGGRFRIETLDKFFSAKCSYLDGVGLGVLCYDGGPTTYYKSTYIVSIEPLEEDK